MNEKETDSIEKILKNKKDNVSQEEIKKKKIYPCFRNSGFSVKKPEKDGLLLEINAIHPTIVIKPHEMENLNVKSAKNSSIINSNFFNNNTISPSNTDEDKHANNIKQRPTTALSNFKNQSMQKNQPQQQSSQFQRILSAKSTAQSGFIQTRMNEQQTPPKEEDEKDVFIKNQSEIRLMLHPKLTREALPQSENLWVAGSNFLKNMSKSNQLSSIRAMEQQTVIKVPSIGPMKKLTLRAQSAASLKQTPLYVSSNKNQNPFIKTENIMLSNGQNTNTNSVSVKTLQGGSEMDKHRKSNAGVDRGFDDCRRKPIVRTSGPYLTVQDREQLLEREARKLNIGDRLFHTGSVTGYKMLSNILYDEPFNPPSNHQFRDFDMRRWVSKNAFVL